MARAKCHHELVRAGLALHEVRRYSAALAKFRAAHRRAPGCPVVAYNLANTFYLLGRYGEARAILAGLIAVEPEELNRRCADAGGRSLQTDAFYLLFLVTVYGEGFSESAFRHAEKHLRRRQRGLRSAWSVREVRDQISAFRREWAKLI